MPKLCLATHRVVGQLFQCVIAARTIHPQRSIHTGKCIHNSLQPHVTDGMDAAIAWSPTLSLYNQIHAHALTQSTAAKTEPANFTYLASWPETQVLAGPPKYMATWTFGPAFPQYAKVMKVCLPAASMLQHTLELITASR